MYEIPVPDRAVAKLADEITLLAAQISAATCRWLTLVAEFDARECYSQWGQTTCADWVAWRCSMSLITAREHVRVARWLAGQELIREAFSRGELSYSKVRALSRMAHVSDPDALLSLSEHATAAQLERIVAATRAVTREDAARTQAERSLDLFVDDDGCAVLRARIPGEDGALVLRALQHALSLLDEGAEDDSAEAREPQAARNADALVLMADTALAHADAQRNGGDRHQVVVHVDVATLSAAEHDSAAAARTGETCCRLADGAAIAAATAQRLACDAGIVTTLEQNGQTLTVGRKTRSIPPAIRRALNNRQPACAFPGCNRTRWLDAHHIEHWARGGHTSLDNLVHLCHHHHQLVHEGGYTVARSREGTPVFCTLTGRRLSPTPAPRRGDCQQLLNQQHRAGIRPLADTIVPRSRGATYDLGMAVDGTLDWTRPPGAG